MASRTRKSDSAISLFPFLSILICSLGVIVFIVVGICLISFANPYISFGLGQSGNKNGKHSETPVYVECHNDTLIILPENNLVSQKLVVPLNSIDNKNSEFTQLLNRIKRSKHRNSQNKIQYENYFVFAIYPEGVKSFRKARSLGIKDNIKIGYEPMDKNWRLSTE